ncbi:cyclic nucleotide-binding domain-containing protein [Gracilinema caldarium]|uniref:Transcriptional regulator, Crp/Fnr family n=1 Tax=Gracilinema caldarium (strain ATCC 51460 / DSM 7334 / H1) TaxID=744872 RepID=F8EZU6_GRAC1|nr:cyclic nucleotide-binding domain-containing protein [Gracilinema caldarium]AEJ18459.1 putative transcriptional regulator, Crp/Fnr family [Gracilinema caldarium DSM 7334]
MNMIPYNHWLRSLWNLLMLFVILLFLLVISYRQIFDLFQPDAAYWIFVGLFIVDIILNFFTTIKRGHIRMEKPFEVRRFYVRTSFWLDCVAALPVEGLFFWLWGPLGSQDSFVSALYLLALSITLVKLLKAGSIFKYLQESLGIMPAARRLLLFAYWLVVVVHLIALGWVWIGAVESGRPSLDRYLRALYWATTTIATIGYGDYTPDHNNNLQIIYTVIIELFGVGMFSYVIANVSSLVANLDVAKSAYRRHLDEVNAFLHAQRIPLHLQERVRDYYSYLWEQQRGVSTMQVLQEFPRSLSQEILLYLNRDVLERVELFCGADELFIREAMQLLKSEVFLPGEYIIHQGEIGDCMYFLTSGTVQVLVDGKEITRLGPGSPFGETALVEQGHRNASVVSIDYSTGYRLSKSDFEGLRQKYPEFDAHIQKVVAGRKKN